MGKNSEYYAVLSSKRIEEPTIYSSWGDAHPRVTGCKAVHKGFDNLNEADSYMRDKGVVNCKKVIKSAAEDTTPRKNSTAYYAVAHGRHPGISEVWYGKTGALEEIREVSGACHKHFRTREQAEAFIEDWKNSYADVWRAEIKKALDEGLRPWDMKFNLEGILQKGQLCDDVDKLEDSLAEMLKL